MQTKRGFVNGLPGNWIRTQQPVDSKGVAKFAGEGIMWTASPESV